MQWESPVGSDAPAQWKGRRSGKVGLLQFIVCVCLFSACGEEVGGPPMNPAFLDVVIAVTGEKVRVAGHLWPGRGRTVTNDTIKIAGRDLVAVGGRTIRDGRIRYDSTLFRDPASDPRVTVSAYPVIENLQHPPSGVGLPFARGVGSDSIEIGNRQSVTLTIEYGEGSGLHAIFQEWNLWVVEGAGSQDTVLTRSERGRIPDTVVVPTDFATGRSRIPFTVTIQGVEAFELVSGDNDYSALITAGSLIDWELTFDRS